MGAGSKRSQREIRNEMPCGDGGELTVGMFVRFFILANGLSKIYILTVKQFFFSAIFLARIFLFPLPVHGFVILLFFFFFSCFLYPYPLRSTHFLTTRPQGTESGTNKTVTHHLQYCLSFN